MTSGTSSQPIRLPLTIRGRSPFDPIRLRWSGIGNVILGVACIGGAGSAGVVFGVLFMLLALATWVLTRFGSVSWYELAPGARAVVGTGALIGVTFLYLVFFEFFALMWLLRLFTGSSR